MLLLSVIAILFAADQPTVNPHLANLLYMIRHRVKDDTDYHWDLYVVSLIEEMEFSENTQKSGGLHNIKEHETKFVNKEITEVEFYHQIGIDFSNEIMPMESEWFLNKAESFGFVNITTYSARARNYAQEWNSILHYNENLSDPGLEIYEKKWRENLLLVIENSKDSMEIENTRLELTQILSTARNSYFLHDFASDIINNIENFIKKYPNSLLIDQAYERLIYWFYKTEKYEKLAGACKEFLQNYPDSPIKEYVKAQLGNAYYFMGNFDEAEKMYNSMKKDSLPGSVYPGWRKWYILEKVEVRLDSIELKKIK